MITRSAANKLSRMNVVHVFHNLVEMSKHVAPRGFPERPTRLAGIDAALAGLSESFVPHLVSTPVDRRVLVSEYSEAEVRRWEDACDDAIAGPVMDEFSGDVFWSKETMTAVRIAAAAARTAVSTVLDAAEAGRIEHAFAVVRPPGHHCFEMPSGFCISNNVVLAARVALARKKRVAIVDWDYHFGDGTAAALLDEPDVTFCSLHCERDRRGGFTYPASPLKGDALAERTAGRMFNIMWRRDDADNAAYICAFERVIVPAFERFRPDVVLISAGYDALKGDSLAGMELTPNVFYQLTVRLKRLGVPVVGVLEGGYDPTLLGRGVYETVDALLAPADSEIVMDSTAVSQHQAVIDSVATALRLSS